MTTPEDRRSSRATKQRRRMGGHSRNTEQEFIDAATLLFAERGYKGTSISDLANELGLTTASMYYHVSDKQDLLVRVLQAGVSSFLAALKEVYESDLSVSDKLRSAVENHVDFVLRNPAAVKVFLRERRFLPESAREEYESKVNAYDEMFSSLIRNAIQEGVALAGDPTLLRVSTLGSINWLVEWYNPDGRFSQRRVRDSMLEIILDRILGLKLDNPA